MTTKRQELIDTALDLFYKNGINSIGINEILKISGIAKRTLYSHFDSKEALIIAVLQQRHNIFTLWLEQKLSVANSDKETVQCLFHALASWFDNKEPMLGDFRGCFFINTSAEFNETNSDIVQFCHYHKKQVRQIISNHLRTDNNSYLDVICIMKEGAIVTAHLSGNSADMAFKCIEILEGIKC